jgi:transposase
MMRGMDETSGSLFSYVDLEERIPPRHPLRKIRQVVNDALADLDAEFEALYTDFGRPSIPPERLIRASLLQILFSLRSERQLMEQMDYNLMFRWFVGLGIDDPVWGEGRPGIDPVDQFSPERAKPRAEGPLCSPRTATGC